MRLGKNLQETGIESRLFWIYFYKLDFGTVEIFYTYKNKLINLQQTINYQLKWEENEMKELNYIKM